MRLVHFCILPGVLFLTGCSVSPLVPDIAAFGHSVEGITRRDAALPEVRSLPERIAVARRVDFAKAGVQYGTSNRDICQMNRPDVTDEWVTFAEGCALIPLLLRDDTLVTAASEYDPAPVQAAADVVIAAGDAALLREQLGYLIREDLVAYGAALAGLAESTDPAAIGVASGRAFDAVVGLKDALDAASSDTGRAAPPGPVRQPARNLIAALAGEVAETMRYRRLKAVVESADPYVRASAVQLAILTYEGEAGPIQARAQRMLAAIDATDAGSAENLAEIEAAYDAIAEADGKALFRSYAEIGRTHAAVLAALREPADLARLDAANSRILALAKAFQDVADALED